MNGSCRPPVMAITCIADTAKGDPNIDVRASARCSQQRGCVGLLKPSPS